MAHARPLYRRHASLNMIQIHWFPSLDSKHHIAMKVSTRITLRHIFFLHIFTIDFPIGPKIVCIEQCTCPDGLEFNSIGSPCGDTCADLGKPCNIFTYVPIKACNCPKGRYRLRNGKCVGSDTDECKKEYNQCTVENTSGVIQANCTTTRKSFDAIYSFASSNAF